MRLLLQQYWITKVSGFHGNFKNAVWFFRLDAAVRYQNQDVRLALISVHVALLCCFCTAASPLEGHGRSGPGRPLDPGPPTRHGM